jgi:hypothetical protein
MNPFLVASLVGSGLTFVFLPVTVAALTAIVTMWVTRAGDAANLRRDRYAQSVETLVAWIEFPYRIRRRTDDEPATLANLAAIGHHLQEKLALNQAWISTEHPEMATAYAKARLEVASFVGPALLEAWLTPPVSTAAGMNLGGWGPARDCDAIVSELQHQVIRRFGFQRLKSILSRSKSEEPKLVEPDGSQ